MQPNNPDPNQQPSPIQPQQPDTLVDANAPSPVQPIAPNPIVPQYNQQPNPGLTQPVYGSGVGQPNGKRKIGIIIGIALVVIALLGFGIYFIMYRSKTTSTASNSSLSVQTSAFSLTNYTSQGGKFTMEVPKGGTISDKANQYDSEQQSINIDGPQVEAYKDSVDMLGRNIYITYAHHTDASQYSTTYADFLASAKQDVKILVASNNQSTKDTVNKEQETTIDGHKAYTVTLTLSDKSSTGTDKWNTSERETVYIYVDNMTYYKLELDTDQGDNDFMNAIQPMISSFKAS